MPPLTYRALLDDETRKVQLENLNQQTAANRATALRGFLRANYLDIEDVVGDEMRLKYPDALERFLRKLDEDGRSARSLSNTRAALRPWREAVIDYDTRQALAEEQGTPFMQAIKGIIADTPVERVARQAGVPKDMLRGWLQGKQPRTCSARYIFRLEAFFGLERSSLITLAGIRGRGERTQLGGAPVPIAYNETVHALTREPYCYVPTKDSPLRTQWEELVRYKTAAVPPYRRTRRGKWRFSPCPMTRKTEANWWAFLDGKEVASAKAAWTKIGSYLGWLRRSQASGGKGIPEAEVGTLAWLAVPDYLEEYLDWCRDRIGKRNQSVNQFLALISALVRPRFGYLRQRPELQATLPSQYRQLNWDELCERQFETTEQLVASYRHEIEVSRDSFAPIRHLIELPQPMEGVVDMIQRMRADRPVGTPRREAIWARDLVLIKLLASNPLRAGNMAHLTWRADNTGELYQRADQSWWIHIPKAKFKNRHGAAGETNYDAQVQPSVWRDIERYLFTFRPKLLREPSDLVFLANSSHGIVEHRPWSDLGHRVHRLTMKYVPRCAGFGPHAFRHLVATAILKSDGGDYKTAALVLNDRVRTVEKHYSGLCSNDGSERMGQLLEKQFNRM